LASATKLTILFLSTNKINDISPLVNNSGLKTGCSIWLQYNPLSQVSINTYITQLLTRGVQVTYL
jgi:hypothetical protein